jgi:predicted TIM-barrel fold metal-dependent hydrolase
LFAALPELGAKRIASMDAAGIDVQVLSLTAPGFEQTDAAEAPALARDTNDAIAAAISALKKLN